MSSSVREYQRIRQAEVIRLRRERDRLLEHLDDLVNNEVAYARLRRDLDEQELVEAHIRGR